MRFAFLALCLIACSHSGRERQSQRAAPVASARSSLAGCRGPLNPGCARCCIPEDDGTCGIKSDPLGTGLYTQIAYDPAPCTSSCMLCARCTHEIEAELRHLGERPDCDCARPPPRAIMDVDICYFREDCRCWCASHAQAAAACPDVVL